jgi:hypothetical protein
MRLKMLEIQPPKRVSCWMMLPFLPERLASSTFSRLHPSAASGEPVLDDTALVGRLRYVLPCWAFGP